MSTTKFVIENELEDGNGQDGGQHNEFIDDAILDEDMDIDNVGKDHEEYTLLDDNHVNEQVTAQTAAQSPVDATSANSTLLQTEVPSAVVKDIQDFMEANGITRIATSEENKLRRRLLDLQSQNTELRLKIDIKESEMAAIRKHCGQVEAKLNVDPLKKEGHGRSLAAPTHTGRTARNSRFSRHIFSCRCSRPCVFYPPSATTARTTSPSQLVAMMNLLELKPELAQKPTELLLLAQANLPFEVDIPSQEALLAMAHCPTLQLMCREEPAWNVAFTHTFSALMRRFFGDDFTSQPVNTLLVLAPGVRESTVTLAFTEKLVLKRAESAEDLLLEQLNRKRYSRLIMILPFATDDEHVDQWTSLMDVVPESTRMLMIPAPTALEDFSLAEAFISRVASVERPRGHLDVISPEDRVMAHKNLRLVDLGDKMSPQDYWHVVNDVMLARKLEWQGLKVVDGDKSHSRTRMEPIGIERRSHTAAARKVPRIGDRVMPYDVSKRLRQERHQHHRPSQ